MGCLVTGCSNLVTSLSTLPPKWVVTEQFILCKAAMQNQAHVNEQEAFQNLVLKPYIEKKCNRVGWKGQCLKNGSALPHT